MLNSPLRFLMAKTLPAGPSMALKSGLLIDCQAIVIAIGTVPNIEIAKACNVECKRGVVVNEYLQTSDHSIFAIGEIAEFKGFLYGITAAAEQQAEIVARYLSGDISKYYVGSLLMNILKILSKCSKKKSILSKSSMAYNLTKRT